MSPLYLRESRFVRMLWASPAVLAFIVFFAAWFTALWNADGLYARGRRSLRGDYRLSPESARWLLLIVGGVMVLALTALLARSLISASTKSLTISDGGITACWGNRRITLLPTALSGVRISRLMIGSRVRLGSTTPPFILSLANALRFAQALEHLGIAYWSNDLPSAEYPPLDVDETVVWEGRPGLPAFARSWWLIMIFAVPAPLIFATWLWNIWSGGGAIVTRLLYTYMALFIVGFTAIGVVTLVVSRFGEWSRDLAGTIAITDKRIAWRSPWNGTVYREVAACDLLSAALVETTGRRGWIGLSIRGERGRVEEIDLFNLPRPEAALAAIEAIMPAWVDEPI